MSWSYLKPSELKGTHTFFLNKLTLDTVVGGRKLNFKGPIPLKCQTPVEAVLSYPVAACALQMFQDNLRKWMHVFNLVSLGRRKSMKH